MKVKSSTNPRELGKSVYSSYTKEQLEEVTLRAIGAGAVSQALKGIIIGNTYLAAKGVMGIIVPSFRDIEDGEESITAIEMKVKFTGG